MAPLDCSIAIQNEGCRKWREILLICRSNRWRKGTSTQRVLTWSRLCRRYVLTSDELRDVQEVYRFASSLATFSAERERTGLRFPYAFRRMTSGQFVKFIELLYASNTRPESNSLGSRLMVRSEDPSVSVVGRKRMNCQPKTANTRHRWAIIISDVPESGSSIPSSLRLSTISSMLRLFWERISQLIARNILWNWGFLRYVLYRNRVFGEERYKINKSTGELNSRRLQERYEAWFKIKRR